MGFIEKLMSKENLKELEEEQFINLSKLEKDILKENTPLPKGKELQKRFYTNKNWYKHINK